MKLTGSDIQQLYGKKLFVLEDYKSPVQKLEVESPKAKVEAAKVSEKIEEVVAEPEPPKAEQAIVTENPNFNLFTSGKPVTWKMKATSRFALILQKSEFTDRSLTTLLKASLVKAGINPALVGFGVIEDGSQELNLQDMSVDFALICSKLSGNIPSPFNLTTKKVWLSSPLSEISNQPEKQQELDAAMQALASML